MQGWVDLVGLVNTKVVHTLENGSLIPVLTGLNAKQLRSCDKQHYYNARPQTVGGQNNTGAAGEECWRMLKDITASSTVHLTASVIYWDTKISQQYCPLIFTFHLMKNNSHLCQSDWQCNRDSVNDVKHVDSILQDAVSPSGRSCLIHMVIGPIPWGHSRPLCQALSLLLSSSWTSMRRRRATVAACDSSDTL